MTTESESVFPEKLPPGNSWESAEDDEKAKAAQWGRFEAPPRHKEALKKLTLRPTTARTACAKATGTVVLYGDCGCGKTLAAVEWLREEVMRTSNNAPSARFISAPALARLDRYDDKVINPLLRVRRLVIDDLGTEYNDAKGAFTSLFDEVINARHAARLPTVITTNLGYEAFSERYGERVIDRITESGAFTACGSQSLRTAEPKGRG